MKFQISLTVEAGKRLIAKAIASLPQVERAMKDSKIIVKGGTTTSALVELLCGFPMAISGRIVRQGAGTANQAIPGSSHALLIDRGVPSDISGRWEEVVLGMGPGDLCISGANLIDRQGQAALMAGAPIGGQALRYMAVMSMEGVEFLIAAGLEKWAPCLLNESIAAAKRKEYKGMGMAVGLVPVPGRVIDEPEACRILGAQSVHIIGRGGLYEGQGGCTLVVDFDDEEKGSEFFTWVRRLNEEYRSPSGHPLSLEALCLTTHCGPLGARHCGCIHKEERVRQGKG